MAAGMLEVGTTGKGEVVVNHAKMEVDAEGRGYIIFSPAQAKAFASLLISKAVDADLERENMAELARVADGPET